ncbi:fluoride efflux transporter CrcB [Peredibacter starrii]|uniref:Fluoride-specific ion channel FluC n=1 Tax=Peredibacter starrii TaxID=28202 RepID=A0AAX4HNL8_9BACT|nr:fluoride efflux transporter CrcB [Peredibacter starrii]WPU64790.1 fluoride efflux transporter CrcB [Peredibacter starrii]
MDILLVGLAGSLGAIGRYLIYQIERSFPPHNFPFATLFINLVGCFIAGLVLGFATKALPHQKHHFMLFSIGFVGSFTTFSTLTVETLQLAQHSFPLAAIANVLLNFILGVLLVWIGQSITI